jgi:hypothetical protein
VKAVAVVTSQLPVDVALGCTGRTCLYVIPSLRKDSYKLAAVSACWTVVWRPSCFPSVYLFVSFFIGRFFPSNKEVLTEGSNN